MTCPHCLRHIDEVSVLGHSLASRPGTVVPGAGVVGSHTMTDAVRFALKNGVTFVSAAKAIGEFFVGLLAAWRKK